MATHVQTLRVGLDPSPTSTSIDTRGPDLPGVELGISMGTPVRLNVEITLADCWAGGHVLTLELVGPDGARLVPGRRIVLEAGEVESGTLTVFSSVGFVPHRVGPHALYIHLDRYQAGGLRFLVRAPRTVH